MPPSREVVSKERSTALSLPPAAAKMSKRGSMIFPLTRKSNFRTPVAPAGIAAPDRSAQPHSVTENRSTAAVLALGEAGRDCLDIPSQGAKVHALSCAPKLRLLLRRRDRAGVTTRLCKGEMS